METAPAPSLPDLHDDALRCVFSSILRDHPRSQLLSVSRTCRRWRRIAVDVLRQATQSPDYSDGWSAFRACQRRCAEMRDESIRPYAVTMVVFCFRRTEVPDDTAPPRSDAQPHILPKASSPSGESSLNPRSSTGQAILAALRWYNSLPNQHPLKLGADWPIDQPLSAGMDNPPPKFNCSEHLRWLPVPRLGERQIGRLLPASILAFDTAYSSLRDDEEWPLSRCSAWIDERLGELGTSIDDTEAYFPGDYWSPLKRGADGLEHSGSSCSSLFKETTCCYTVALVTRDVVMIVAAGDEA